MKKSKKTEWKEERPVYLWLALAGGICAIVFYFIPKDARNLDEKKLSQVSNLVLDKDPEIVTRSRSGECIVLHIHGYDKPFQVAGFDFNETSKRNILRNIKSGDTVSVMLDSSEFRKINKETFLDSYTEVHSIIKQGQEYLKIKQANQKAKSDLELGIPVGLYLMIAGLIYWSFKTRPRFSPSIVIGGGLILLILTTTQ